MRTCQEFQIAAERRLHGNLGEAEAAELEEHLSACAACHAYRDAARGAEDAMQRNAEAVLQQTDWGQLERRIGQYRRWVYEDLAVTALALLAILAALVLLPHPSGQIVRPALVLLLALAILAVQAWGKTRWLLPSEPVELLGAWRGRIRREVRWWKRSLWLLPLGLLGLLAYGLWRRPEASEARFLAAVGLVVAAASAYELLVRLPRARREWSDLEER